MTRPPEDDRLVRFLKDNTPTAPPADRGLEDRILSATHRPPRRRLWLVPTAIAAGLLVAWGSYRTLTPDKPTPEELAELEAFMTDTWECTLDGCNELEFGIW